MDRLRVKSNKAARKLPDAAEVRLEASLNRSSNLDLEAGAVGGVASGSRIVREVVKAKEVVEEGHINFWKDFEAGVRPPIPSLPLSSKPTDTPPKQTTETTHKSTQQKAKEAKRAEEDSLTKVFLGKIGEGDVRGWYAAKDGMTERERKEGVEGGLERAYVFPLFFDSSLFLLSFRLSFLHSSRRVKRY